MIVRISYTLCDNQHTGWNVVEVQQILVNTIIIIDFQGEYVSRRIIALNKEW